MRRRISITAESAEETLHNRHTGEEPAPYSVVGPVSRGGEPKVNAGDAIPL